MKFFPYCGITHTEDAQFGVGRENWSALCMCQFGILDPFKPYKSKCDNNLRLHCLHQIFGSLLAQTFPLTHSRNAPLISHTDTQTHTKTHRHTHWHIHTHKHTRWIRWWWGWCEIGKIISYKFRGQRKVGDTLNWSRQPADWHTGGRNVGTDLNSFKRFSFQPRIWREPGPQKKKHCHRRNVTTGQWPAITPYCFFSILTSLAFFTSTVGNFYVLLTTAPVTDLGVKRPKRKNCHTYITINIT